MRRVATALLAAAVVASACGGGDPRAQASPTVFPVSTACARAFAAAPSEAPALGDAAAAAPASPVPTDVAGAVGDLYATVEACGSVDEWTEAFRGHVRVVTRNADAVTVLRSLCSHAADAAVRDGPVCREVALPDAVGDTADGPVGTGTAAPDG